MARSQAYLQQYKRGPFAGMVDPWAEAARYFHQIHGGMIDALIEQWQDDLIMRGFHAGRETSLQIVGQRRPDIYVQDEQITRQPPTRTYNAIAAELQIEPARITAMVDAPELDAIHIRRADDGTLVTVVEIISPRNKTHPTDNQRYQEQRQTVFLAQDISVVEIDATRSNNRLIDAPLIYAHAYHIAVFRPHDHLHVHVSDYGQALKSFVLPLHNDGLQGDAQAAYDTAYQRVAVAGLIQAEKAYGVDALPMPTTFKPEERADAIQRVQTWQTQLAQLTQS